MAVGRAEHWWAFPTRAEQVRIYSEPVGGNIGGALHREALRVTLVGGAVYPFGVRPLFERVR